MRKNKLIVLEGLHGTGKTAISRRLVSELKKKGVPAVWRKIYYIKKKEKYDLIRPFIKRYSKKDASFFFYISMLIYRLHKIENLLKKQWVIIDRGIYNTIAHHYAWGVPVDSLIIEKLPIPKPDYLFWIDVEKDIRLLRIKKRGIKSEYERMKKKTDEQLEKYERYMMRYRPIVIENNGTIEETVKKILKYIHF